MEVTERGHNAIAPVAAHGRDDVARHAGLSIGALEERKVAVSSSAQKRLEIAPIGLGNGHANLVLWKK